MTINISIERFKQRFDEAYDFLYDHRDNVAGYDEAVDGFDAFLKNGTNANSLRLEDYILHLLSVLPDRIKADPDADIDNYLRWNDSIKSCFAML